MEVGEKKGGMMRAVSDHFEKDFKAKGCRWILLYYFGHSTILCHIEHPIPVGYDDDNEILLV